ncbi:hypothetical protein As57867_023257, partial [Aphanomyces stellatus]
IVSKWPSPTKKVLLQHDNALAHVTSADAALRIVFDAQKQQGWSFELAPQPPNSPDTNILDLGFFAAIQSLQHRKSARSIDELVVNVACAFETYPFERLNHTFLTLQSCLVEILKLFGDNTYKIPHLAKEKQGRLGRLPGSLEYPHDVFAAAVDKLERLDGANLDRVFAEELEAAQQVDELAPVLEGVALNNDETDDITTALNELGIELIHIDE